MIGAIRKSDKRKSDIENRNNNYRHKKITTTLKPKITTSLTIAMAIILKLNRSDDVAVGKVYLLSCCLFGFVERGEKGEDHNKSDLLTSIQLHPSPNPNMYYVQC